MVAYSQFHHLEEDVALAFVEIITAMDAVYLAWEAEEAENRRKDRGGSGDHAG